MSADQLDLLTKAGAIAVLALEVLAFIRGDIVPGYIYRAAVKDRDDAWDKLDRALHIGEAAIEAKRRT